MLERCCLGHLVDEERPGAVEKRVEPELFHNKFKDLVQVRHSRERWFQSRGAQAGPSGSCDRVGLGQCYGSARAVLGQC